MNIFSKDEINKLITCLKDNIPIEENRSEGTNDNFTHYEEDIDSWQYKLYNYVTKNMSREDELFEEVKLLNKQNIEIYEKYCNLLKEKSKNTSTKNEIEIMRAIVHNKILLMVVLSKLGMEDDEIDELNVKIYNALDKEIEKVINGDKNENN